jgi:IMP dehydrogenase
MTIIAGNVATAEGALDIYNWGADVIKVGIGPGSCCQTRENTGVGVPQLSALVNVREALPEEAYIIADGGIKKTGDIAKALKYADAVMMGGFFAGTTETPGHVYETMGGDFYKTMAGSASAESKVRSGNKNSFVEGGIRQVPFRGHVKYILAKAKENIQSSFSYSGAKNMEKFKKKSKLIKISGGGKKESKI